MEMNFFLLSDSKVPTFFPFEEQLQVEREACAGEETFKWTSIKNNFRLKIRKKETKDEISSSSL